MHVFEIIYFEFGNIFLKFKMADLIKRKKFKKKIIINIAKSDFLGLSTSLIKSVIKIYTNLKYEFDMAEGFFKILKIKQSSEGLILVSNTAYRKFTVLVCLFFVY